MLAGTWGNPTLRQLAGRVEGTGLGLRLLTRKEVLAGLTWCSALARAPRPLSTLSSATDWLPDAGNGLLISSSFLLCEREKCLRCNAQQGHWVRGSSDAAWPMGTVCARSAVSERSAVSDFATPRTVARQAPLSMGFSRQEHWSGLPFPTPGDLPPTPRNRTCVS